MRDGAEWLKCNGLLGEKIWLNTTDRKILLAGILGFGRRTFDYAEIRGVEFRRARNGASVIHLKTNDVRHPSYEMAFYFGFGFNTWKARLESELNLAPTVRVK